MKRTLVSLVVIFSVACAPAVSDKERASARIRYDLGVTALNAGDLRTALRELLASVEQDPYQANARNALGLVLHASGRHEEALEHYNRAVELDPKFSEAYNNRGVLLRDMGRYTEAIESFKVAVADILYTTPSLAEGNLGWTYYQKGDVEVGIRHLRNSVATNPKFCQGYGWLAQISLDTEKPDQAIAYCKRFTKHCVEDPEIAAKIPDEFVRKMHLRLGSGYLAEGKKELAREALDACIEGADESETATRCDALRSTLD